MQSLEERQGRQKENEELFEEFYEELKKIAISHMNREKSDHTLQPTALVNEAYLKMMTGNHPFRWKDKKHFLCTAADVMRRVLIDSARARNSQKRGGGTVIKIELDGNEAAQSENLDDVLSVHEALLKFEKLSPEKAQLVKLRYFAGLTVEEAANAISISTATAYNYWLFGRAWLHRELTS